MDQRPEIRTMRNLEAAFAGEAMAHAKYRYFARLARQAGDEETARAFALKEVLPIANRLDPDQIDVALAGLQDLLPRPVALHFGRG